MADAITHTDSPGQTLYVRLRTSSTASVAAALTEGTSSGVGYYTVTEAALVSAGLSDAGAYPFKVFVGTPSTSADDVQVGEGELRWDGTAARHTALAGLANESLDDVVTQQGGTQVSADVVVDKRTWFAQDGYRASNIIEVKAGFAGTLALAPKLNPETAIVTVSSVVITGPASVTTSNLARQKSLLRANFDVPALSTVGTYTVKVTVTTTDSQTIPTTATLKVY